MYNYVKKFSSFIYKYVLKHLWIQYDIKNLDKCKIMKLLLTVVENFFRKSLIQINYNIYFLIK